MEDNKKDIFDNHDIIHDNDKKKNRDHYHGKHHFTKSGKHDDVDNDEFLLINNLKFHSKQELIYKLSASSIILALAILLTLGDSLLEHVLTPLFKGAIVPIRILDVLVVFLAIPIIGPIFGGIIGFLVPWFHILVHSAHNPIQMLPDAFAYFLSVWFFWFSFYGMFKNSPYHRDPNPKIHLFKRWMPIIQIVFFCTLVFSCSVILSMYIIDIQSTEHTYNTLLCSKHNHEHSGLDYFLQKSKYNIIILIFVQLIRFIILYVLFALLEQKLKILNHHYR